MAVGGDKRMPVFGRLNDRGVKSYEVEEAMSKVKGGKAPGLDKSAVEFLKKGGRSMVAWLVRLLNYCFETGRVPRDWCRLCIVPLYKGKGTDVSAVTPGHMSVDCSGKAVWDNDN